MPLYIRIDEIRGQISVRLVSARFQKICLNRAVYAGAYCAARGAVYKSAENSSVEVAGVRKSGIKGEVRAVEKLCKNAVFHCWQGKGEPH